MIACIFPRFENDGRVGKDSEKPPDMRAPAGTLTVKRLLKDQKRKVIELSGRDLLIPS